MPLEPFVLDGEDWFGLPDESVLPWSKILAAVESEQQRLAAIVADISQRQSPMADAEGSISCSVLPARRFTMLGSCS